MKLTKISMMIVGVVAAVVGVGSTAGASVDTAGREFGQHVSHCAQTIGFDGAHNPGMHRGYAGWDGMPCPDEA